MGWTVETLNETVDNEIGNLPRDMRARLARIAALIEAKGLELVGEPHVRHIEGPIWEMRGPERDLTCAIRHHGGAARNHTSRICEENRTDPTARD